MENNNLAKWLSLPIEILISHIQSKFHKPLQEKLPQIQELFDYVVSRHGSKEPELCEAHALFSNFSQMMPLHLLWEEQILFPLLIQYSKGGSNFVLSPIQTMENEHSHDLEMIQQMRILTHNFTPPSHACRAWKRLYAELEALFNDLEIHIELENDVLFQRCRKGTAV